MTDETVVTGTVPESTDTAPAVPTPTVEGQVPDAAPAETPKTPAPRKEVDPRQKEISKLSYQLREQNRHIDRLTGLVEKTISARPSQPADAPPKLSDFGSVEEFLDARDKYTETKRAPAKAAPDDNQKRYNEYVESSRSDLFTTGSEKYEDFEDLVGGEDIKITPLMRDSIFDIEDLSTQAEVAYYLAKNQKEAVRISKLSPVRQAKEIDRLEQRLTATPQKRASAAPAPIEPIGGTTTQSDTIRPEMKFEDFIKVRNKQLGRK